MDNLNGGTDAYDGAICTHDKEVHATHRIVTKAMHNARSCGASNAFHRSRLFRQSRIHDGDVNCKTVVASFGDHLTSVAVSDRRVGTRDNLNSVIAVTEDGKNFEFA